MKINDSSRVGRVNPYRKSAEAQAASSDVKKSRKDEVQISTEAKEMLSSLQGNKKLDELKQSVSTGTYHVDAQKIAEKLWPYMK
ncbi:flagellar biosynthesis anti-sigma factor FlgM [Gorillibacterium sp. sgz5001074]|uniref:flagellar biosynthesis anti-sigma factor FlgM n=1 Tax=Gorillibacterium sp. sgz5001074 TaxID=3446695 RepID=UPI003F661DE4